MLHSKISFGFRMQLNYRLSDTHILSFRYVLFWPDTILLYKTFIKIGVAVETDLQCSLTDSVPSLEKKLQTLLQPD